METYLSLTARSNMRITAIHIKAVRNNSKRMVVRGSTRAWGENNVILDVISIFWSVPTCNPPRSNVRIKEQASEAGNPVKESIIEYCGFCCLFVIYLKAWRKYQSLYRYRDLLGTAAPCLSLWSKGSGCSRDSLFLGQQIEPLLPEN